MGLRILEFTSLKPCIHPWQETEVTARGVAAPKSKAVDLGHLDQWRSSSHSLWPADVRLSKMPATSTFHNRRFTACYKRPTFVTFGYSSTSLPPTILCAGDKFLRTAKSNVGRDSSVGTATRYGLDGPGDRILVGAHPSRPVLGPTQPPIQWVLGLSQG